MERPAFLNRRRLGSIKKMLDELPKGNWISVPTQQILILNGVSPEEVEELDDWSIVSVDEFGMPRQVICSGIEDPETIQFILWGRGMMRSLLHTINRFSTINKILAQSRRKETKDGEQSSTSGTGDGGIDP